ncbi:MAG: SEL1-like repeat protein [Pseudarcicella sp.]|nr:SEL1-like repeat protein [Pseudarcicella sp.]
MKKINRIGLSLLLLLGTMQVFSQEKQPDDLVIARTQLKEASRSYNPAAALKTFIQKASEGNAEAMNAIALIYSKGLGVPVNEALALEWFEKSAQKGYANAYYNMALLYKEGVGGAKKDLDKSLEYAKKAAKAGSLEAYVLWGLIYKEGLGVPQDYKQALNVFEEGATKGSEHCFYAQGYMHYKGFGTKQDYTKAVALFQQAADLDNAMGTYMLGYCYRNGYGVSIDAEKAKFWFTKAADFGLERANAELEQTKPENATPNQALTLSTTLDENVEVISTEFPKKLPKLKQKITKNKISGEYTGNLLRYDWSGQNVLSNTAIQVTIDQKSKDLTGIWIEHEGDSIAFKATIEDKEIAFQDTKIDRFNHYDIPALESYQFKNAKLQIIENHDDIYLVGNLQLFNTKYQENEKPMYIILKRKADKTSTDTTHAIVSKVVIYPNPVASESFKLSFDLKEQTPIAIKIYDFSGNLKYEQNLNTSGIGLQEQMIPFRALKGNYILNLYYNNQVLRTILIKK